MVEDLGQLADLGLILWPARRLGSAAAAAAPLLIVSFVSTATPAKAGEGFAMLGVGGSTHGLHSYQGDSVVTFFLAEKLF